MAKKPIVHLDYLPGVESFLDPDRLDADRPGEAKAVVIPFGLEATVSYGRGFYLGWLKPADRPNHG